MVARAGLPLQDLEFVQFHPTGAGSLCMYIAEWTIAQFASLFLVVLSSLLRHLLFMLIHKSLLLCFCSCKLVSCLLQNEKLRCCSLDINSFQVAPLAYVNLMRACVCRHLWCWLPHHRGLPW